MARPPLGGRGLPLLAQPQPGAPDPLVEETQQPPRAPPTRLRPDRIQEGPRRPTRSCPTGIGPKYRAGDGRIHWEHVHGDNARRKRAPAMLRTSSTAAV